MRDKIIDASMMYLLDLLYSFDLSSFERRIRFVILSRTKESAFRGRVEVSFDAVRWEPPTGDHSLNRVVALVYKYISPCHSQVFNANSRYIMRKSVRVSYRFTSIHRDH
jgi:hypothetical protein